MTNPESPTFVICHYWWCFSLVQTLPCQKGSAPLELPSGHSPATDLLCDLEVFAIMTISIFILLRQGDVVWRYSFGESANNQQLTLLPALELVLHSTKSTLSLEKLISPQLFWASLPLVDGLQDHSWVLQSNISFSFDVSNLKCYWRTYKNQLLLISEASVSLWCR